MFVRKLEGAELSRVEQRVRRATFKPLEQIAQQHEQTSNQM